MSEQDLEGRKASFRTWASIKELRSADEVWIHCSWMPCLWWAALWGKNIHWMPECSYDPIRRAYHGWKKTLVGPIERFCLRRAKTIVATCEAEKGWIQAYLGRRCPPIEVTDIKRFFKLQGSGNTGHRTEGKQVTGNTGHRTEGEKALHLLYLGRRHPLKGLVYLEAAVKQIQESTCSTQLNNSPLCSPFPVSCSLRIVSNATGKELDDAWNWCDVLILPTLSDNFGLVIAETLERGKRVITTDGAPAWGDGNTYGNRLTYLRGYRDGTAEQRVQLLKSAISHLANIAQKV